MYIEPHQNVLPVFQAMIRLFFPNKYSAFDDIMGTLHQRSALDPAMNNILYANSLIPFTPNWIIFTHVDFDCIVSIRNMPYTSIPTVSVSPFPRWNSVLLFVQIKISFLLKFPMVFAKQLKDYNILNCSL